MSPISLLFFFPLFCVVFLAGLPFLLPFFPLAIYFAAQEHVMKIKPKFLELRVVFFFIASFCWVRAKLREFVRKVVLGYRVARYENLLFDARSRLQEIRTIAVRVHRGEYPEFADDPIDEIIYEANKGILSSGLLLHGDE